jgi:hypothetical protein
MTSLKKIFILSVLSVSLSNTFAATSKTYVITSGELRYQAEHSFHETLGISKTIKGKAVCQNNNCEFLIAVPVKSFDSQNGNRDAHMLEVTKGAEFPMVSMRLSTPMDAHAKATELKPIVNFAGQSAPMKIDSIEITESGSEVHVKTKGSFNLVDFAIKAPSLLGVSVKDLVSVESDIHWKLESEK